MKSLSFFPTANKFVKALPLFWAVLQRVCLLLISSVITAQIAEKQEELTVVISASGLNLDPHTSSYSNEAQILSALYEGLFTYNPISLKPEKGLVSSYKISRDKKTWTFMLRDDIRFSDGTPITAETIKKSWLSLLSPETDAPYASLLDCIKGAADTTGGKCRKPTTRRTA